MDSYEQIYTRMKEKYEEESGFEVDGRSDVGIRLRVLAGEIYNMQTSAEWLKRQMFMPTATGGFLDLLAQQRGLERFAAQKSQGELVFSVTEPSQIDIHIPEGCVVSTDDETPVRVYTTRAAVLGAGESSVTVSAQAEEAGYAGNISPRSAVVAVSVPAGIDSVINLRAFRGGSDAEGDLSLRERLRESYTKRPNAMNSEYYKQLALSVDGVEKSGVVPRARGTGTINIYVSGASGIVTAETLEQVQSLIDREKEINLNALVQNAVFRAYPLEVEVTPKAGYESGEVVELCSAAFSDYINSVPIGGKIYLSYIGKYLLETGCIENYTFGINMENAELSGAERAVTGTVEIEVVS